MDKQSFVDLADPVMQQARAPAGAPYARAHLNSQGVVPAAGAAAKNSPGSRAEPSAADARTLSVH